MDYKKSLQSLKTNINACQNLPSLLDDVIKQGYYERLYNLIYYTVLDNQSYVGVGEPLKIILNKAVDQVVQDLQKSSKISVPKLQTKRINYSVDVDPLDRPQTDRIAPKPIRMESKSIKIESKPFEPITGITTRTWSSMDSRAQGTSTSRAKKTYTFSKEERFHTNKRSPGPGDYEDLGVHRDRSPKTVFAKQQRKSMFEGNNKIPGPGEYNPIN